MWGFAGIERMHFIQDIDSLLRLPADASITHIEHDGIGSEFGLIC
jgi:hypothetical protein